MNIAKKKTFITLILLIAFLLSFLCAQGGVAFASETNNGVSIGENKQVLQLSTASVQGQKEIPNWLYWSLVVTVTVIAIAGVIFFIKLNK